MFHIAVLAQISDLAPRSLKVVDHLKFRDSSRKWCLETFRLGILDRLALVADIHVPPFVSPILMANRFPAIQAVHAACGSPDRAKTTSL